MSYDTDEKLVDLNLFTRRIFNYIQLNEDITNKINSDIPLIAKQKISKVFMQGITLWSFFNNGSLWYNSNTTSTNNPDNWFMKHVYENAEFDY
jgi:hypothetical protein